MIQINFALSELISDSPSELAFAVAHEMGHIYQQRNGGTQLFNSDIEFDADEWGALLSLVAGYDPYAGAGTLAKLAMATGTASLTSQFEAQQAADAHKSFNTRLDNIYAMFQNLCSTIPTTCNLYKSILHPNFPPTAPLSLPPQPAPKDETTPHIYTPLSQNLLPAVMLVLRSRQSVGAAAAALRRVTHNVNPHQPITITPLRQRIAVETSGPRFHLMMLGSFGLLALTLAAFGVFSVTEYVLSLRRHEMAVRSSLGASPAALLFLMLGAGTKLLVLGVAAGMLGTAMIAKLLAAGFPEVRLNDPQAIGAAVLLVIVAAVGANWMAARRVTHIDPATMLRSL